MIVSGTNNQNQIQISNILVVVARGVGTHKDVWMSKFTNRVRNRWVQSTRDGTLKEV